jgi:hypothetical protein
MRLGTTDSSPLRPAAAAVAVALVLAACGGGGGDGGSPAASGGGTLPSGSGTPPPGSGTPAPGTGTTPPGSGTPTPGTGTLAPLASADFRVNTTVAGRQDAARIARLSGGGFVTTWTHQTGTTPATEVRLQRFDVDARPAGDEKVVAASGSLPGVGALADGGFAVTWTETTAVEQRGLLQLFDADGTARGPATPITASLGTFAARPVGLPDGRLVVASDSRAGTRGTDIGSLQLFTAQGTPVAPAVQVNESPADTLTHVLGTVAAPLGPGFAAAWAVSSPTDSRVVLGLFGADGHPASPFVTVASGAQMRSPSLTTLSDGKLALAWVAFDTGPSGALAPTLWLQRFDSGGGPLERQSVPIGLVDRPFAPHVASTLDGGLVLTWSVTQDLAPGTTQRVVSTQRFDASGQAVAAPVVVRQVTFPSIAQGADESLDVTGARPGQYFLVYGSYSVETDWDVLAVIR